MKAIIVGAGEVGYHLVDRLSKEGHHITLIERDIDRETQIRDKINAEVILGNGVSAQTLEEAGISEADLFIAVTNIDEVNMVGCMLASQYNVKRKIARVKSLEYTNAAGKLNAEKLGIELLINPQSVVADEICEMVAYSDAVEAAEFAEGKIVFVGYGIHEDHPLIGKTLKQIHQQKKAPRFLITAIHRRETTLIPRGTDAIEDHDVLYLVCNKSDLNKVRQFFGFKAQEAKNIFILGGGNVGLEVARRIADGQHNVKVIDRNEQHCQKIADQLEDTLVLCANSTDVETLKNEGISKGDAFVAVTDDDQSNILGSLLAKRYGVKRAITLVNQPELSVLANSLGIDACVSPRLATASAILKYIRSGNVLSIVERSDTEVLELQLSADSAILDTPIKNLSLPKGVIIGAIARETEVIIPHGDDELKADDHVIVFTLLKSVPKVEKFFS